MKRIFTLLAFFIPVVVWSQNKTCTNQSLSIDLNTPSQVNHKVGTPYIPIMPIASSTIHPSNQISLVKKSSDVDANFTGIYTECFEATDKDGLKVECCRNVVVLKDVPADVTLTSTTQLKIYPNPIANDQITIQLSNFLSTENLEITLLDVMGRQVFNLSQPYQSLVTITTEDYLLNSGLYVLVLKQGDVRLKQVVVVD